MTIESTTQFAPSVIEGSASRGGWQVTGAFMNSQADVEYGRNLILHVLPEGDGKWEDAPKIAIDGSIVPQSLVFDRRQSSLSVTVATADVFLESGGVQGIYFTDIDPSTNVHQIPNLNLGKIILHIVQQHTNVTTYTPGGWVSTARVDTINSTTVDVYTVQRSDSIWQTIANIAANEFYVRYFTKNDELVYEPHPQFKTTIPTPRLTIDQNNMVAQPDVTFRDRIGVDQVQLYALTDTGAILQSFYPANVGTEGRRQKFANLRCNSQARLDLLAQRAYKFLNRRYDVKVQLAGPWGAYLELYDRVQITYTGTVQNGVTIDWDEKKFWIEDVRITRMGRFNASTELALAEEQL